MWKYIRKKLKKKWSPRQIAEELEKDYPLDMAMRISPEAIYTYIYILPRGSLKKELTACLRQNRKRRHKQSRGVKMERKIEDMLSIEERPREVEDQIRQFFPKGTDFNKVSRYEVKKVQDLLNGRPRQVLDFEKPYEVFNQLINSSVALNSRN